MCNTAADEAEDAIMAYLKPYTALSMFASAFRRYEYGDLNGDELKVEIAAVAETLLDTSWNRFVELCENAA